MIFIPLEDKEVIDLGVVQLQVLHTPGHTPESACFVVTDRATGSSPWAVLYRRYVIYWRCWTTRSFSFCRTNI